MPSFLKRLDYANVIFSFFTDASIPRGGNKRQEPDQPEPSNCSYLHQRTNRRGRLTIGVYV